MKMKIYKYLILFLFAFDEEAFLEAFPWMAAAEDSQKKPSNMRQKQRHKDEGWDTGRKCWESGK